MKPIIGIIGRYESVYDKSVICVFDNYRKCIIKYGGIPLLILPTQEIDYTKTKPADAPKMTDREINDLIETLKLCNGIIMPGGTKRFEIDSFICDYCNKNNIPLLGICMGMQIMCNYNNDNKNIKIENHYEDADYKHKVKIENNSFLYELLDTDEILVNSFHNYKVANSGSYKIAAKENDVIEAVYKDGVFNLGVQWHPEKNYDKDINSKKIIEAFIKASILNSSLQKHL